jgi:hypothetical protein
LEITQRARVGAWTRPWKPGKSRCENQGAPLSQCRTTLPVSWKPREVHRWSNDRPCRAGQGLHNKERKYEREEQLPILVLIITLWCPVHRLPPNLGHLESSWIMGSSRRIATKIWIF